MKRSVILGLINNYTFKEVGKFILSLKQTGYRGDIVLFAGANTGPLTIRALKKHGVTVAGFKDWHSLPEGNLSLSKFKLRSPINYFNYRHYLYYDFLLRKRDNYDTVMLSDVKDVFFQGDPFNFEITNPLHCALESRSKRINDCSMNRSWVVDIYGEDMLRRIGDQYISCAGTTWGTTVAIIDYLEKMLTEIQRVENAQTAIDQAIHNKLIYNHELCNVAFMSNEQGLVMTMGHENDYQIDNNKIKTGDGKMVHVLHQYDRRFDAVEATDRQMQLYMVGKAQSALFKLDLLLHKSLHKLKLV